MIKLLFALSGSLILLNTYAQTNISGGIYSDETWTLANSPYIITDTVVVFPGVTLTIEPGVVVKFNIGTSMEVRQANIFAEGTVTDSITFTSNEPSPVPNMYSFWLNNYPVQTVSKFNYCSIHYGSSGIYDHGLIDTLIIRNSSFTYNNAGVDLAGGHDLIDSCNFSYNVYEGVYRLSGTLDHSTISHNQTGIWSPGGKVQNCIIEYNQVGLYVAFISILSSIIKFNQTGVTSLDTHILMDNCNVDSNTADGIILNDGNNTIMNCEISFNNGAGIVSHGWQSVIKKCVIENNITGIDEKITDDSIYCNKICNNSDYDFKYSKTSGSNIDIANNYWCTTDSATIASHIYDGYDNITLGLVSFLPLDTIQCYLYNSVSMIADENPTFTIYPNPAKDYFTISSELNNPELEIFNAIGDRVYIDQIYSKTKTVKISLATGIYFVKLTDRKVNLIRRLAID